MHHFVFCHSILKRMKTKMCNKGRESPCLAAKQCVGPLGSTCSECLVSVCACLVVRPQKEKLWLF